MPFLHDYYFQSPTAAALSTQLGQHLSSCDQSYQALEKLIQHQLSIYVSFIGFIEGLILKWIELLFDIFLVPKQSTPAINKYPISLLPPSLPVYTESRKQTLEM